MAATMQAQIGTGASVSWANAETGAKFSREDSLAGTTPSPIPTATGTNYSWIKNFVLSVTGTAATTISNRRIFLGSGTSTGLALYYKAVAVGSYAQSGSGTLPGSSGSNGAVPAGYTLLTTTAVQYDNTSVSSGSTGPNGSMAVCVLGIDNTYVGGSGSGVALPNIILEYDEA